MQWVRDLYDWVLKWSESKYGTVALVVMAFAEASYYVLWDPSLALCLALELDIFYGGQIQVNFPGWLNSFLILFLALPKTFFTEFRNNIMRGIFG